MTLHDFLHDPVMLIPVLYFVGLVIIFICAFVNTIFRKKRKPGVKV